MTEQDKKPFALLMGEIGAAFGRNPEKETMAVYFKHMADYSLEAVTWAIDKAVKTEERFPVIKTLRELANSYRPTTPRQTATDAVQIAECTVQSRDEAKASLDRLMAGIENWNQSEAA